MTKTSIGSVNIPGIIAGVLALVSLFSPWWGIVTTGFNISASNMFGPLFMPGQGGQGVNSSFAQTMNTYATVILVLALAAIAFAFIGSFTPSLRPLAAGLFFSISSLVSYTVLLNYALSQNCQGNNNCIRQVSGSSSFFSITTTWGFQIGFYVFLGGTVSMIVAVAYHQITTHTKRQAQ